ncbi:MAG TPA: YggS family pyridoxal phosphate-dependent enzyme, partial [Alloacidobacterium sp.]|nr:YggS family pyridoxal phosphate-dependent enzyme [Alloacidobacterium sp.]
CMLSTALIAENIRRIEERIHAACLRSGRDAAEVKLMAVSKTHPAEAIASGFAAGLRLFGENRVQEFQQKLLDLSSLGVRVAGIAETPGDAAAVHLIGHLQSNKTGRAAEVFSGVDTVDSLKLAERLDDGAKRLGRRLPVLVEIKLSDEEAKTGLEPESRELADLLERLPELGHIEMRGMMSVAPFDDNPETARACFRRLRLLREELAARYSRLDFSELSMGMSGDFEIAIEEGSTLVRIGTAIFGARPKPV